MPVILQIDFTYEGPFGETMTKALNSLAHSITEEPGFIWKIWTENEALKKAGGIYLFMNEKTANAYKEMHSARMTEAGAQDINAIIFELNSELSSITHFSKEWLKS